MLAPGAFTIAIELGSAGVNIFALDNVRARPLIKRLPGRLKLLCHNSLVVGGSRRRKYSHSTHNRTPSFITVVVVVDAVSIVILPLKEIPPLIISSGDTKGRHLLIMLLLCGGCR